MMKSTKTDSPVHIDTELCKGCKICVYTCPQNVLALSESMNSRGYNVSTVANPEDCIKCKQCEIKCPDLAISVES